MVSPFSFLENFMPSPVPKFCSRSSVDSWNGNKGSNCFSRTTSAVVLARSKSEENMVEIWTCLRSSESASACYHETCIMNLEWCKQTCALTLTPIQTEEKRSALGVKNKPSILPWLERGEFFQPAHTLSYEVEFLRSWKLGSFDEHKPDYP